MVQDPDLGMLPTMESFGIMFIDEFENELLITLVFLTTLL